MATVKPDRAFLQHAILDTIVPEASNATLPDVLNDDDIEEEADDDLSLLSIRQRDRLFFGQWTLLLQGIIISYSFLDIQMNE
jgi:hypothetical protein